MKFTRIAGCKGSSDTLYITHDYGNFPAVWSDITGAYALKVKNPEGKEIPFLFFSLKGCEGYYYVDGQKISSRLFSFDRLSGNLAKLEKNFSSQGAGEMIEKRFQWLAGELCAHIDPVCIDTPLLESIKSSTLFLPSFHTIRDALGYCEKAGSAGRRPGQYGEEIGACRFKGGVESRSTHRGNL